MTTTAFTITMNSFLTFHLVLTFLAYKSLAASFKCPSPSGYFADPNNCIKYYHCFNGVVEEHKTCPVDPGKVSISILSVQLGKTYMSTKVAMSKTKILLLYFKFQ